MRPLARLALAFVALVGLFAGYAAPWEERATHAAFTDVEGASARFRADVPLQSCAVFWADRQGVKHTLLIAGSLSTYDGCVHSNADVELLGVAHTFNRTIRYVTDYVNNSNGHMLRAGVVRVAPQAYPYHHALRDFAPGGCQAEAARSRGEYHVHAGNVQIKDARLKPGLHFVFGDAQVDISEFRGRITIVATGKVHIESGPLGTTPYANEILVFADGEGPNTILSNHNGGNVRGAVYAPKGDIHFTGNAIRYKGQIEAMTIQVDGNGNTFLPRISPVGC